MNDSIWDTHFKLNLGRGKKALCPKIGNNEVYRLSVKCSRLPRRWFTPGWMWPWQQMSLEITRGRSQPFQGYKAIGWIRHQSISTELAVLPQLSANPSPCSNHPHPSWQNSLPVNQVNLWTFHPNPACNLFFSTASTKHSSWVITS